jgi:hypothetical protein
MISLHHDYHQTLTMKLFMSQALYDGKFKRKDNGKTDVFLNCEQALDVIRRVDNLTLGIPKIIYLVGWQYNGHDSKYPAWFSANEAIKRPSDKNALESIRWLMKEARKYHTTVSLHLNMFDAYEDSPLWDTYVKNNIIARNADGSLRICEWGSPVDYAQEWRTGFAQKRIDSLCNILPLSAAATVHIDAFHSWPPKPVPDGKGGFRIDLTRDQISPFNGFSVEDETEAQRNIFRYWASRGVDVTSEGVDFLRETAFEGYQPMAWWFGGALGYYLRWPASYYCGGQDNSEWGRLFGTSMHAEDIVKNDPAGLKGFRKDFCLKTAVWYFLNRLTRLYVINSRDLKSVHFSNNVTSVLSDGHFTISQGERIIQDDENLLIPAPWIGSGTMIAYSSKGYKAREWVLPEEWSMPGSVTVEKVMDTGLVSAGEMKVAEGKLTLSMDADEMLLISNQQPFFPGTYPGTASGSVSSGLISLGNDAVTAEWVYSGSSVSLKKLTNKYDGKVLDMSSITLFAIETDDGRRFTNMDLNLKSAPELVQIAATDTLPTEALRFAGKEIHAQLESSDRNIRVNWKAQLRNGSNYVRQNINVSVLNSPVRVKKVILFDGNLQGTVYEGMVIGSPAVCGSFFFGFEHPVSLSNALLARNIGPVTNKPVDVSRLIDREGEYVVSVELGSSSDFFNINSVSLLENGKEVCSDSHLYLGNGGKSEYRLKLSRFRKGSRYQIKADLINPSAANGEFQICRKRDGLLNFYVNREDELTPGKSISEWSVMGVSPEGQTRRAFLYYLERERAHPYRQFMHYNCWWDITTDTASFFTSDQILERMRAWNAKFIMPYNVKLKSFVFDDGWDNVDSVWYFDPHKFPNGFAPQAALCRNFNSGIGVWMSPFGGYGENKARRLKSAPGQGLETNDKGLSLAGPNYFNRFLSRASVMLDDYKVNYFKFDGFGGSEPKYLPDMEAGTRLISLLRQHNPDVFINITVGSWPSPFWLKYADCTWRGSGDLHMAGKGTRTNRFMTYRDGTLYSNIVAKAPLYTLNSIMTVGIAYARYGLPKMCINDSISDFKDMVWSSLGGGSALQELYISHDRMKPEFWPILAAASHWVKDNESVFQDTHWIGGNPLNLEIYGFASWTPQKGIITLRNPDDIAKAFNFSLKEVFELPEEFGGRYLFSGVYGNPGPINGTELESDSRITLNLKPFQVVVLEVYPDHLH